MIECSICLKPLGDEGENLYAVVYMNHEPDKENGGTNFCIECFYKCFEPIEEKQ